MEYRTEFGFKKAIKVDETMLRDIVSEMKKYCENVKYEATLENGDSIKFESLDEMISFENSKINSFGTIYITARDGNFKNRIEVSIQAIDVFIERFYETISVEMNVDSIETKTIFKSKFEEICTRHEQDKRYNFISKTGIFNIISALYFVIAGIVTFDFIKNDFKDINDNLITVWLIVSIVYLIKGFLQKLQKKYYPPIVFYLGDGISIYDRNERARENFFWGGIVAVLLGIVFLVLEIILS